MDKNAMRVRMAAESASEQEAARDPKLVAVARDVRFVSNACGGRTTAKARKWADRVLEQARANAYPYEHPVLDPTRPPR